MTAKSQSAVSSRLDSAVFAVAAVPAQQAYKLLHVAFVAIPTIAGLDKFSRSLCNWGQYLAPQVARASPISGYHLMFFIGLLEIAAGLLVVLKPRIGGLVLAAWFGGIIVNLLLLGKFYDVALRDVGLLLAAIALSRLATTFSFGSPGVPRVRTLQ